MVNSFEQNYSGSNAYLLNEIKFEVLLQDFVRKIQEPRIIPEEAVSTTFFKLVFLFLFYLIIGKLLFSFLY